MTGEQNNNPVGGEGLQELYCDGGTQKDTSIPDSNKETGEKSSQEKPTTQTTLFDIDNSERENTLDSPSHESHDDSTSTEKEADDTKGTQAYLFETPDVSKIEEMWEETEKRTADSTSSNNTTQERLEETLAIDGEEFPEPNNDPIAGEGFTESINDGRHIEVHPDTDVVTLQTQSNVGSNAAPSLTSNNDENDLEFNQYSRAMDAVSQNNDSSVVLLENSTDNLTQTHPQPEQSTMRNASNDSFSVVDAVDQHISRVLSVDPERTNKKAIFEKSLYAGSLLFLYTIATIILALFLIQLV